MSAISMRVVIVFIIIIMTASYHPIYGNLHSGANSQHSEPNNSFNSASPLITGQGNIQSSTQTFYYVTSNVTIPTGSKIVLRNENIVIQSLDLTTVDFNVSGTLKIENSTMSVSGADYSVSRAADIFSHSGSRIIIENSTLDFPGVLNFQNSTVNIVNSTLNSTLTSSSSPFYQSLLLTANNSYLNIYNSSISGVYNQKHTFEYVGGSFFCNSPEFSKNEVIPMSILGSEPGNPVINRITVSINYSAGGNENWDFLWIYLKNNLIENYSLPYTNSSSYVELNFTITGSNLEHRLNWFSNSSNFSLVLHNGYPNATYLNNLTEYLYSNDTVSLYGQNLYNIMLNNSTLASYDSSYGLNYANLSDGPGELNPFKHSIVAHNSTLYLVDSTISNQTGYSSPFFVLSNSTVFLFKVVRFNFLSNGIAVSNVLYNLSCQDSVNQVNLQKYQDLIKMVLSNDTKYGFNGNNQNMEILLYDYFNSTPTPEYSGNYALNTGNSLNYLSITPFPFLSLKQMNLSYELKVPYAGITISRLKLTESGPSYVIVNYSGNSIPIPESELSVMLSNSTSSKVLGDFLLSNLSGSRMINLTFTIPANFSPGNYRITVALTTKEMAALNNSGTIQQPAYIYSGTVVNSTPMKYVSFAETGLGNGLVWGISVNGTSHYTNSSSLGFYLIRSANVTVIVPPGYSDNMGTFPVNVSSSDDNYTIKFTKKTVELTVYNQGLKPGVIWYLTIDGIKQMINTTSYTLILPPAAYNYEIMDTGNYRVVNGTGIVNISTGNSNLTVKSLEITGTITRIISLLSQGKGSYLFLLAVVLFPASFLWWRKHSWLICSDCNNTRKSRSDLCPGCRITDEVDLNV